MTLELAREVAASIGALDGVAAVALGGSLARGRGDTHSDVDLGIYYDPARPFSIEALRALVAELDDRHAPEVVGFGDWGPWINGGAWTRIRGTKVDLLYRDLGLVDFELLLTSLGDATCRPQYRELLVEFLAKLDLDEDTRRRVMDIVQRETRGKTVILVTHDPREAADYQKILW